MSEQIANNAVTTLFVGCAHGDVTITVSDPSAFPATPQFRILVGSGSFADAEIMTVTAVNGNIFTVIRASEPTAGVQTEFTHPPGSVVAQVLTEGALFAAIREVGRIQLSFAYGDATPEVIGNVPANKIVESVGLVITQPFDGAGAALAVGDAGTPDGLMAASENDPAQAATFGTHPGFSYGGLTVLKLRITPGAGATQGAGLVVVNFQV